MKFKLISIIIMAVILVSGWSACAKAPEVPVTPAPVTPAPVTPVELRVSFYGPPQDDRWTQVVIPLTEQVAKGSEGRLKFSYYPGAALSGPTESWTSCSGGTVDISLGYRGLTPGQMELSAVYSLPFQNIKDLYAGNRILWELYQKVPEIKAEFDSVKLLLFESGGSQGIFTTKKEIRKIDDLTGLKIRAVGLYAETLKTLGATPVTVPMTETYEALQKGVIDGAATPWETIGMLKFYEAGKYFTEVGLGCDFFYLIMNKNAWNRLSPNDQKLFDNVFTTNAVDLSAKIEKMKDDVGKKAAIDKGVQIYTLTSAERASWQKASQPVWDGWVTTLEAKGKPGKRVLEEMLKAVDKYSK